MLLGDQESQRMIANIKTDEQLPLSPGQLPHLLMCLPSPHRDVKKEREFFMDFVELQIKPNERRMKIKPFFNHRFVLCTRNAG